MKRKPILLGLATIALLVSCGKEQNTTNTVTTTSPAIHVEALEARINTNSETYNYSGLVTPSIKTPLSFQLPGTIESIYVEEGDVVKKGQLLAKLSSTTSESSYRAARAMQIQAQDAYERLKIVYDKGSLPDIEWEEIKSKLEQANAAEQIAKNNLDNCSLKAPKDGVVGSRNKETGESAMPGISVIDLVTISDVFIRISVPENEINRIKKNQRASVIIPAISQNTYHGKVEKIGVMANQLSKTYEVKIRLRNTKLEIKPGMVCDVDLNIENHKQLVTIPSQAVIKDSDNKHYVYLVDKKLNTSKKQEVVVGEFSNNNLQIISGIKPGDLIVVSGQHKLKSDSNVTY